MKNINYNKIIKIASLCLFGILTLIIMFNRIPFWDEAHSWMIAKSFSFWELISQVERKDGHLFLWHLLQMPFAKNDFYYPYPSYIMNWLFCMGALIIFWQKAPFKNIEKFFITFSCPFVFYFAPIARCYSLGILFLFIILSLWKDKLKHPLLVPFLIICFANTSAMALCATVPLGFLYVYDLIKNKERKYLPFLIFSFGAFLVLFQLLGAHLENLDMRHFIPSYFIPFFILPPVTNFENLVSALFVIFLCILFLLLLFLYKKQKETCFFLAITYGLMITIFSVSYIGSWWHYLQFYIYFIAAVWLMRTKDSTECLYTKLFNYCFIITLCLYFIFGFFFYTETIKPSLIYNGKGIYIYQDLEQKGFLNKENKIFTLDYFSDTSVGILPYMKTETYNVFGDKKYSIRGIQNYYRDGFSTDTFDMLAEKLDDTKTNLGITSTSISNGAYLGKKYNIYFDLIYSNADVGYSVYKIIVRKRLPADLKKTDVN